MLKTTRWAVAAALLQIAAALALPTASLAQAPAPAPAAQPAPPAPAGGAVSTSPASVEGAKGALARAATPEVENPYGLEALWRGSDWVAKGTLIILAIMSMGSWYVIITKLYEQAKLRREGRIANAQFWKAPSVKQGAETLREGSPFRFLAESGLEATNRHDDGSVVRRRLRTVVVGCVAAASGRAS